MVIFGVLFGAEGFVDPKAFAELVPNSSWVRGGPNPRHDVPTYSSVGASYEVKHFLFELGEFLEGNVFIFLSYVVVDGVSIVAMPESDVRTVREG